MKLEYSFFFGKNLNYIKLKRLQCKLGISRNKQNNRHPNTGRAYA